MVGIMISVLYVEKLRHREVKSFVQGHTEKSVLEQGPRAVSSSPEPIFSLNYKLSPLRIQHLDSLFQEIKKSVCVFFFPPIEIVEIL